MTSVWIPATTSQPSRIRRDDSTASCYEAEEFPASELSNWFNDDSYMTSVLRQRAVRDFFDDVVQYNEASSSCRRRRKIPDDVTAMSDPATRNN